MDDETFCREAAAHIDVPSLMRYTLLVQGMALCDNILQQHVRLGARDGGGRGLLLYPVDMDLSCSMTEQWTNARGTGNERTGKKPETKKRRKTS